MEAPVPDNEEDRLQALRALKFLATQREERFDRITRMACATLDVRVSAISLIDRSKAWIKSIKGLEITETSRSVSFCAHTILSNELLIVPDASQDRRFSDNPFVMDNPKIRFYAGYPLSTTAGLRVGAFCIVDFKPITLSIDKLEIFRDLGKLAQEELLR